MDIRRAARIISLVLPRGTSRPPIICREEFQHDEARVPPGRLLADIPLAADAARPISFDDIMAMRRIETPVISPDGAHVLYVVRK
jgi:hypothetical protein